jgi:hypothetical protein
VYRHARPVALIERKETEDMHDDLSRAVLRRQGRDLAQRSYHPKLFPVGYDFDAALALFNQHCQDAGIEPMDERFYDSDPGTESMEALCAFFSGIEELAPYQGPEYEGPGGTFSSEPTAAWEHVHPFWREDDDTRHYGRLIQIRRRDDGFHLRIVCPELLWEHGPYAWANDAMEAGKTKLDMTLSAEHKSHWQQLQHRLASADWQIGEGDRHV